MTATVTELQEALAAGDMQAVCRRLTESARRQAGSMGHGLPTLSCRRDLRRAFAIIAGGLGDARPTVTRVVGSDSAATATVALPGSAWRARVPLVDDGGRWKLAGFFGASEQQTTRLEQTAQERPFPDPPGRAVRATGPDGEICGELSDQSYPEISGGCTLKVSSPKAAVRMLTPFGALYFAHCTVSYRVSVDGRGRTWTDRWAAGDTTKPGCSDIEACNADTFDLHPWKGRIVKDPRRDGYLHHIDLCLRTCVGNFAGRHTTRLLRKGDRWRISPTNQGATGFKVDDQLTTRAGQLALRH